MSYLKISSFLKDFEIIKCRREVKLEELECAREERKKIINLYIFAEKLSFKSTLGTIHILRKHLKGGRGGSENANFCLFSILKPCLRRG